MSNNKSFLDMSINEIGSSIGSFFCEVGETVVTTNLKDIGTGIASLWEEEKQPIALYPTPQELANMTDDQKLQIYKAEYKAKAKL